MTEPYKDAKYVIKEDELTEVIRLFRLYGICPVTINALEQNVRSRPLEDEIKKVRVNERERILNAILKWETPISRYDIEALLNAPTRTTGNSYCTWCVDGIAAPCKIPEIDCKRGFGEKK